MMKIGLDLHGVLTRWPILFKAVLKPLKHLAGIKIYIITGPPYIEALDEVHNLGLEKGKHYDELYSVVDHLKGVSAPEDMWQDENGRWWAEEKAWWGTKAEIASMCDLDFHVDDSPEYGEYFTGKCVFVLVQKEKRNA